MAPDQYESISATIRTPKPSDENPAWDDADEADYLYLRVSEEEFSKQTAFYESIVAAAGWRNLPDTLSMLIRAAVRRPSRPAPELISKMSPRLKSSKIPCVIAPGIYICSAFMNIRGPSMTTQHNRHPGTVQSACIACARESGAR